MIFKVGNLVKAVRNPDRYAYGGWVDSWLGSLGIVQEVKSNPDRIKVYWIGYLPKDSDILLYDVSTGFEIVMDIAPPLYQLLVYF